jgi:hypothetical protein
VKKLFFRFETKNVLQNVAKKSLGKQNEKFEVKLGFFLILKQKKSLSFCFKVKIDYGEAKQKN